MARRKMPAAVEAAHEAEESLEREVDSIVAVMQSWGSVATEVLEWANGLTSTNCGWSEYRIGRRIVERWELSNRQKVR